jgi:hypothetical protein
LKLVTITRSDLPLGAIVAQTVHSSTAFATSHFYELSHWRLNSDYVACLAAKNEQELIEYFNRLASAGAPVVLFREPDFENQATSLAFYGTPELRKITSSLPLLFKNQKLMVT